MAVPKGPVGPILETDYINSPHRDHRSDWPSRIAGGKTYLSPGGPRYSWISVLDPDSEYDQPLTGLSGTVIDPKDSPEDNPIIHPFGNDFEFHIAPDERYFNLLAPKMQGAYKDATADAKNLFNIDVPGVIGMEWDGKLVPKFFRAEPGDRVAVWGRWIVDAGHDDYHTEIHPPLIMATAGPARSAQQRGSRAGSDDATLVKVLTRPYLASEEFGGDSLFNHLLSEVGKVMFIFPLSTQVQAHPHLLDKPFVGLNIVSFKVRVPTPRNDLRDKLVVEIAFTQRGHSVAVQVLKGNDGESVRVVIVLNEASYEPPPEPEKVTYRLSLTELESLDPKLANLRATVFASVLASPLGALFLTRGVKTSKFKKPSDPALAPATRMPVADLHQVKTLIDDSQPYPLFGTVKLEWERFAVARQPGPTGVTR